MQPRQNPLYAARDHQGKRDMDWQREHLPGECAPMNGHYEELNVLGARTGKVLHVQQGELLPKAPRGFTWRQQRSSTDEAI